MGAVAIAPGIAGADNLRSVGVGGSRLDPSGTGLKVNKARRRPSPGRSMVCGIRNVRARVNYAYLAHGGRAPAPHPIDIGIGINGGASVGRVKIAHARRT